MNIILTELDFKCLVRGGTLTVNNGVVKIILQDIGFDRMHAAIESAEEGKDIYKAHSR